VAEPTATAARSTTASECSGDEAASATSPAAVRARPTACVVRVGGRRRWETRERAVKPVKPTRPGAPRALDAALDAPFTGLVGRAPSQYPGYVIEGAVVVAGELLTPTGWATRQVNFWPPKASLKPSPVALPALSSLNEYRRRPL
jgi:hypothetical protein